MKKFFKNTVISILALITVFSSITIWSLQNVSATNHESLTDDTTETKILQDMSVGDVSSYAEPATKPGTWLRNLAGKWRYRHLDGTYTKNDWEYINGKWYHFDSNGWMQTGWLAVNGKWYYLNTDGAMQTGWLQLDGKWYYLNASGAMQTGWLKLDGKWYYFKADGARQTGWLKLNDKWYYLDSDGVMRVGWIKLNNKWYYLNSDGAMNTAPLTIGSRYYKFNSSGELYCTEFLITRQQQQKSNWCWAASAVMVGTYNAGTSVTQNQVVTHVKNGLVNQTATTAESIEALKYASGGKKTGTGINPPSFNALVSKMDENKPLQVVTQRTDTGTGHMVVGAGYNTNEKTIRIIDPYGTRATKYFNYQGLLDGTVMIGAHNAKCAGMITY